MHSRRAVGIRNGRRLRQSQPYGYSGITSWFHLIPLWFRASQADAARIAIHGSTVKLAAPERIDHGPSMK